MFALSANAQDNVVPLPESSEDIALLLKLVSGKAGQTETFKSDLNQSLRLYRLVKKYNIVGGSREWASALLAQYAYQDPFECFAVACEDGSTDLRLIKRSIINVQPIQTKTIYGSPSKSPLEFAHLSPEGVTNAGYHTATCFHANPAYFSPDYISRIGIHNYASYVAAWQAVDGYTELHKGQTPDARKRILEALAEAFGRKLAKWVV